MLLYAASPSSLHLPSLGDGTLLFLCFEDLGTLGTADHILTLASREKDGSMGDNEFRLRSPCGSSGPTGSTRHMQTQGAGGGPLWLFSQLALYQEEPGLPRSVRCSVHHAAAAALGGLAGNWPLQSALEWHASDIIPHLATYYINKLNMDFKSAGQNPAIRPGQTGNPLRSLIFTGQLPSGYSQEHRSSRASHLASHPPPKLGPDVCHRQPSAGSTMCEPSNVERGS
ncbi:hypothetical protein GQ53DRAFT_545847 [Thozetella sp. PMI_491]|nr:hypothetical protein GQ53DRAFT_545847 [Thozetella sp. PMI_491]